MITENLQTISDFLALRNVDLDSLGPDNQVDLLVLLGSSLLDPIYLAEEIMSQGKAKNLLISGGIGHSTEDLRERVRAHGPFEGVQTEGLAEADIIRDILVNKLGMDATKVFVENESTTCGLNAERTRELLDEIGLEPESMIILQDPTMQLRSQASFEAKWEDRPEVEIFSYAPFMPELGGSVESRVVGGSVYPVWDFIRFISLLHGELPRLRDEPGGYGPRGKGFIAHVDIPRAVEQAYRAEETEMVEFSRGM